MAQRKPLNIRAFAKLRQAFTMALLAAVVLGATARQAAHAQTFQVIHNFTNGLDGERPYTGLTIDRGGNLYGTTQFGGNSGNGTVFEMTRRHGHWSLSPLYNFGSGSDGGQPQARPVLGPHGLLYGTTVGGGTAGYGEVYELLPPVRPCTIPLCFSTEIQVYSFGPGRDGNGSAPSNGDVVFDPAGNAYGTTISGGINQTQGVVYKLAPSNGHWVESVLFQFDGASGVNPYSGVTLDSSGNLYGTTYNGAAGYGTVYKLSPSGSGWTEHTICTFQGGSDGGHPWGGLIFDQAGNLYGTTYTPGTVFKLSPPFDSCNKTILYSFNGNAGPPGGTLAMDASGNLYGNTAQNAGHVNGEVFKLEKSGSSWIYNDLHDFSGGADDGETPYGGVVLDSSGNIYGTTYFGGTTGDGIVWEITP